MFDEIQKVVSFIPTIDKRNIESFRKYKSFFEEYALIDLDTGENQVSARLYGSGSTIYCVVWIYGGTNSEDARGYGKARGGGYHKTSAAMCEALAQCGVKLEYSIHGRGEGAMKDALRAMAVELGVTRPMIHYSHA